MAQGGGWYTVGSLGSLWRGARTHTHTQHATSASASAGMSALAAVWMVVVRAAVTVRLYLHLLWIAMNREALTLLYPPRPRG